MTARRPAPPESVLAAPYWDAARAGRLEVQRCDTCGARPFPPRRTCPDCGTPELTWDEVSGRGTVWTYTVAHRAPHPAFADQVPLVIAVVALDEGPQLTTNIVGCEPDLVAIGMPVQVTFLPLEDVDTVLPVFEPIRPGGED